MKDIKQSQYFPAELFVLCCPNKANLSFKAIDNTKDIERSQYFPAELFMLSYLCSAALNKANLSFKAIVDTI